MTCSSRCESITVAGILTRSVREFEPSSSIGHALNGWRMPDTDDPGGRRRERDNAVADQID